MAQTLENGVVCAVFVRCRNELSSAQQLLNDLRRKGEPSVLKSFAGFFFSIKPGSSLGQFQ